MLTCGLACGGAPALTAARPCRSPWARGGLKQQCVHCGGLLLRAWGWPLEGPPTPLAWRTRESAPRQGRAERGRAAASGQPLPTMPTWPPGPFALPAGKPLPCSPGALRSRAADRWVGHALLPRCPGQAPASGSGREAYSCYLRSTTVGVELGQPPAQATPFLELGGGRWVALPHPPWPVPPAGVYLEPRLLEHTVSPSAADVLVAR